MGGGQYFILDGGVEDELLLRHREEVRAELELAASLLGTAANLEPDSVVHLLASQLGSSITLLDREGRVVAASSDLPARLRGVAIPLDRSEIQAALAGRIGFAERRGSGGVGLELIAAAPMVLAGENQILLVTVNLDETLRTLRARGRRTLGLFAASLLLAVALTSLLGRFILAPIETMGTMTRALSAGTRRPEFPSAMPAEVKALADAMDEMMDELATRLRGMEEERDEMRVLIDFFGEAVVSLTEDGRVLRANRTAMDLLGLPRRWDPEPVRNLVTKPVLRSLLEGAVARPFSSRELTLEGRNYLASSKALDGGGAVVTFVDVTEIRRVETVRRDFVANASHEMKTPLTALRGFAETLLEDDLPDDLRRKWIVSIRTHALRLQRLVEDLLDLSRLESGGWIAQREVLELSRVVEEVFADYSALASESGVSLTFEGDALVSADGHGLEQVLKNLVENSIRYSPAGGRINVTIGEKNGSVRVEVGDEGPGIPPAALSRIFERFYRVDPARSRSDGGTGLGLAIVRHLVHAMHGQVWAESELGKGTTVIFTLPAAE